MALSGVVSGGERNPPRVVLYAGPGVGKTTFAVDSEKPFFISTENDTRSLKHSDGTPVKQFPKCKTWKDVLSYVKQIVNEEHDYKTLVFDTIGGIAELCKEHVCLTKFNGQYEAGKGGGFLSYYQGYDATAVQLKELIDLVDECHYRGMMVIMLAHAGYQNVKHPTEEEYQKHAPDMYKSLWAVFCKAADVVMRADYNYIVTKERNKKGKATTSTERVLYCSGNASEDSKCRGGYEVPESMELLYSVFAAHLGNSGETVTEVRELMKEVLTKDEQQKTMQWLGVKKLEDAPITKLRQMLNRLKGKQAEKIESETEDANTPSG